MTSPPESWWQQTSWLPQIPILLPGTLAQNIAESHPHLQELFPQGLPGREVRQASRLAGFEEVVAKLPEGWNTFLRAGGEGLSVGTASASRPGAGFALHETTNRPR